MLDVIRTTRNIKRVCANSRTRRETHLLAKRAQLFCINPIPYTLHVVPVGHDAVFHGVFDLQQPPEFLGFPANENVPFEGTRHDANVLRPSNAGIKELSGPGVASVGKKSVDAL